MILPRHLQINEPVGCDSYLFQILHIVIHTSSSTLNNSLFSKFLEGGGGSFPEGPPPQYISQASHFACLGVYIFKTNLYNTGK